MARIVQDRKGLDDALDLEKTADDEALRNGPRIHAAETRRDEA